MIKKIIHDYLCSFRKIRCMNLVYCGLIFQYMIHDDGWQNVIRYLFFLIPVYCCVPEVRAVQKRLPKILHLSPLNKEEKKKYLQEMVLMQIAGPSILGGISFLIAMLLFDKGVNWYDFIVLCLCMISVGIGKNAFPSNESCMAKRYNKRQVLIGPFVIGVAIINMLPYALNYMEYCSQVTRKVFTLLVVIMIVSDYFAIRILQKELEICVNYEY